MHTQPLQSILVEGGVSFDIVGNDCEIDALGLADDQTEGVFAI